jgi:hypothetical protein
VFKVVEDLGVIDPKESVVGHGQDADAISN